jgi:hypothetical protein
MRYRREKAKARQMAGPCQGGDQSKTSKKEDRISDGRGGRGPSPNARGDDGGGCGYSIFVSSAGPIGQWKPPAHDSTRDIENGSGSVYGQL